jgi:hypothetical protein
MAYVFRTYSCDGGGEGSPHQFEVMLASGEHPRFCPQCGCEVDPEALPIPSKIAVGGSAIARATDMTYSLVESSSAARAAELGQPGLKVTDMNDNLRHGDVAAKRLPVSAEFASFERERQNLGLPSMVGWGGGLAASGDIRGGGRVAPPIQGDSPTQKFAGPGHIALHALQPEHDARVQQVVASPTHKPYRGG